MVSTLEADVSLSTPLPFLPLPPGNEDLILRQNRDHNNNNLPYFSSKHKLRISPHVRTCETSYYISLPLTFPSCLSGKR